jgi:transposase
MWKLVYLSKESSVIDWPIKQMRIVLQAPIPPRIVPKGMVDESLIAQIIVEKIQFHTPIYRFAKKIKQEGIDFVKQNNLHNWFHAGAESLKPLYNLLIEDILSQGYVQGDETRIPVLAKNKIGAAHRGQMWAFFAPTIRAVGFNYEPTRSTKSANVILDQFKGILQTDGYVSYEKIGQRKDIQLIFCMAHGR